MHSETKKPLVKQIANQWVTKLDSNKVGKDLVSNLKEHQLKLINEWVSPKYQKNKLNVFQTRQSNRVVKWTIKSVTSLRWWIVIVLVRLS
jgi:hypothetical protein